MPFKAGAIYGEAYLNNQKWMSGLSTLEKSTAKSMGIISAVFATATIKTAKSFNDFQKALTNVSTLVDTNKVSMLDLKKQLLDLNPELGNTTDITKGVYQAFSSGASTLKEAMDITVTSATFAKSALTDTNTAVDVLTTAINAYGKENMSAQKASDLFFTTIKDGKITGEQLAGSIGTSIPLFSSAGIKLKELATGLAAMTKEGVDANSATTQLNAIVNSFLKPSDAMIKRLNMLGYESGSAFLKAEGLTGALKLVEDATGGDATKIAELLPNIRAMRGAMALTGEGGKEYTKILEDMNTASGATAVAFSKQEKTWDTAKNALSQLSISVGEVTKGFVDMLARGVINLANGFKSMNPLTKTFIGNFLAIGTAITGAVTATILLKGAFTALSANPIGATITGLALVTTGLIALYKTFHQKDLDDAKGKIQAIADELGITADKIDDLSKATVTLEKTFTVISQNGMMSMNDAQDEMIKKVGQLSEKWGVTKEQIIASALQSDKIDETYKNMLKDYDKKLKQQKDAVANDAKTLELASGVTVKNQLISLEKDRQAKLQEQIADKAEAEAKHQQEVTAQINAQIEAEKERVQGVIADRKTALKEYQDTLSQINTKVSLGLIDEKDRLKESADAANTYIDALIRIGYDGADATQVGNQELRKTIALHHDQERILKRLAVLSKYQKELDEAEKKHAKDTAKDMVTTWKDYFNIVKTGYQSLTTGIYDILGQSYTNQLAQLTNQSEKEKQVLKDKFDHNLITEEEYNKQVAKIDADEKDKENKIKEKQFKAEKFNRISNVIQSASSAIAGWWEVAPKLGPIAGPIFAGAMTAATIGMSGKQIGLISKEEFVPEYEFGGTKTGTGLARVNEKGGEIQKLQDGTVIIPNDISKMIATASGKNIGNINVSFSGANINSDMDLNYVAEQVSRKLARKMRVSAIGG